FVVDGPATSRSGPAVEPVISTARSVESDGEVGKHVVRIGPAAPEQEQVRVPTGNVAGDGSDARVGAADERRDHPKLGTGQAERLQVLDSRTEVIFQVIHVVAGGVAEVAQSLPDLGLVVVIRQWP